jgi:hypothetical protein
MFVLAGVCLVVLIMLLFILGFLWLIAVPDYGRVPSCINWMGVLFVFFFLSGKLAETFKTK